MLLERYIFGMLLRNFLVLVVVVTAIVFLGAMAQNLRQHFDVSLAQLLGRFPYLLPVTLSISFPLSILVATLITYGRLSADNEILAVRMGGIHPFRVIAPAIVLGLLASAVALVVSGSVAPLSSARAREVTSNDLKTFLDNLEEQRLNRFRSRSILMSWRDVSEDGWLLGFFFRLRPAGGVDVMGEATRARIARDERMENLQFELEDVTFAQGDFVYRSSAKRVLLAYPVANLFRVIRRFDRRELFTNAELRYFVHRRPLLSPGPEPSEIRKLRVEYWKRIGLSLACFVFVFVGAPVGILFRRGSFVGSAVVALVLAFVVYYPLHEVGKEMAQQGVISPVVGLMAPGAIVCGLGVFLHRKVYLR